MHQQPLHVDVSYSLKELALIMKGKLTPAEDRAVKGVALDTRALGTGDLFFALKAVRDGHDYVSEAFSKGACAAVVHREVESTGPLVRVKDTYEALADLARHARKTWGKTVIAISGSNGKTTTREMTTAVLSAFKPTHQTPGTWNNTLGVPLSLLLLKPQHELAVLEMGISDFHELKTMAEIAEPNIGVLTNVGPTHLEKLGSVDGVARAKGELFEALGKNGVAVINADDAKILELGKKFSAKKITISLRDHSDISARVVRDLGSEGLVLSVQYGSEKVEIKTPFVGVHNIYNLLCALGAALAVGVPASLLQTGVSGIRPPEMRLQSIHLAKEITLINDCYNANPASTLVALEVIHDMAIGRAIAVLGDMLGLGDYSPRAHRDVGIKVASYKFNYLFAIGRYAGDLAQGAIQGGMTSNQVKIFETHDELSDALIELLQEKDTILLKGSRGMTMERIAERLMTKLKGGTH